MRWLKKILGRQDTHEQWLEKHPGKGASKSVGAVVSQDEEASVRAHMEEELDRQRERREEA